MSTFKITNITNQLGKRDYKYNSVLEINYVDNMLKQTIKVRPNDTIYLTLHSLPISVHVLRVKNLITVSEVSDAELNNVIKSITPKPEKIVAKMKTPLEKPDDELKPVKKNIKKEKEDQ